MTAWNQVEGPGFRLTFGYPDEEAYADRVQQLVADGLASGIAAADPTLWGEAAESEAAKRLAWVSLHEESRPLVSDIAALRAELVDQGLDRVVLCGMGGSSLAPEVICGAAGVPLEVLDSSAPDMVRACVETRLERTVVVVSSKSGGTVETDSQRRAFEAAFEAAGIDPATRIVVVTDPGSPLDKEATDAGCRVFRADPDVGGRYSALTAFGLVPSGLAGADISQLLDQAAEIAPQLAEDSVTNPALRLGALLGHAAANGVDKLVLVDSGSPHGGLGDWIEQLVAESTGKEGTGLLPIVVPGLRSPNLRPNTSDSALVSYGPEMPFDRIRPTSSTGAAIDAPLGAQFLLWEHTTAVIGQILGINPFDQPDVESAKAAARELLEGSGSSPEAAFRDGAVSVYAGDWLPGDEHTLESAVKQLLARVGNEHGYLAVQAYLDRHRDASFSAVRETLADRLGRPVTFGWGPRFLHSTGQYHKGGPATGVFLQITAAPVQDLPVPGRDFTFQEFLLSQAAGDGAVLEAKGCPVLRLHLQEIAPGLEQVRELLS